MDAEIFAESARIMKYAMKANASIYVFRSALGRNADLTDAEQSAENV
jgi:hypothetical protein